MTWETVFGTANLLAMVMWAGLILLPRWPALLAAVLYAGVGLLCLAYSAGLIGILTGALAAGGGDAPADFTSIEGVRGIFASDGGATIGWIHYLAFDMFAGLWIARDADAKGFRAGSRRRSCSPPSWRGRWDCCCGWPSASDGRGPAGAGNRTRRIGLRNATHLP